MSNKQSTQAKPDLDREAMPYRDCAGIAVFNRAGDVFLGRRTHTKLDPEATAWQMPQGGIDKGEDPRTAALRELYEETSIRSVTVIAEAPHWIYYDLPDEALGVALKGKYRGQRQKWFAVLFEGDESEINVLAPAGGTHPAEFDAWRWEALEKLPEMIVPFKRAAYYRVLDAFRDVPDRIRRG